MNVPRRLVFPRVATVALALATAFTLASAAPAAAPEPVGARIDVLAGTPTTNPAGQPFHIRHGWSIGVSSVPNQAGLFGFELDVDGSPRAPNGVLFSVDSPPETTSDQAVLIRNWLFNFPAGMLGTHTFTGRWIAPCTIAVEELGYPGPCTTPNEKVVALERWLTVEFVRANLALGKAVSASGEYPGNQTSLAVDGSWWSYWSAGGFPPQWIEVDLGAAVPVGEIDLGITQLPDCNTVHRLYGRTSVTEPYVLLREFSGFTVDQQILAYVAPGPTAVRFVRVETTSSCSWVGWREIEVYGPSA